MYENIDLFGFERLCKKQGYDKYTDVSKDEIEKYQGVLPNFLLAVWEKYGLSSHGEGYIWTVLPDDYADVTLDFFGKNHTFYVFARNSFGMMYALENDKQYVIQPQIGRAVFLADNDDVSSTFKFTLARSEGGWQEEHKAALKKLGPIDADHMYGYVPMLALGGDGSLGETQIVKTREYLALVADVVTEANRNGWDPLGLESESA